MAQLISYLHHLYTLFIIIRGFASRASRTLDWTRTLTFWAVSGFWLTKTPLIGHCVIEINRYVSDLLQSTTLQKQSGNTIHLWFWPEVAAGYFRFVVFFLVCFFPESWTWLHTYFLKSSCRPIFSSIYIIYNIFFFFFEWVAVLIIAIWVLNGDWYCALAYIKHQFIL